MVLILFSEGCFEITNKYGEEKLRGNVRPSTKLFYPKDRFHFVDGKRKVICIGFNSKEGCRNTNCSFGHVCNARNCYSSDHNYQSQKWREAPYQVLDSYTTGGQKSRFGNHTNQTDIFNNFVRDSHSTGSAGGSKIDSKVASVQGSLLLPVIFFKYRLSFGSSVLLPGVKN